MMIAPVSAALAEATSAHMSDRRFLPGQGTSPPPGPPVTPSPPVHPTSPGITGITNTHPPAYSASRPPIIADTTPTGYDSKPIA
jgi:hypothetical protein